MRIVSMMSGTSVDGIDVAIVDIHTTNAIDTEFDNSADRSLADIQRASAAQVTIEQQFFTTMPWDDAIRSQIFTLFQESTSAATWCRMNFLVAEQFAQAAQQAVTAANLDWQTIDLIASHGQTIWHDVADGRVSSTLQIGDPSVIAARTSVTTIGNFRTADVAVGGQGAPLVSLYDWLVLRPPATRAPEQAMWRAVQNIGGIGNVTFLPPLDNPALPLAFDTGPGNVFIDWAAEQATNGAQQYDIDGRLAAAGRVSQSLLADWLTLPYFTQNPPKSTGRELFHNRLVEEWQAVAKKQALQPADFVATVTELTAASIADAYTRFAPGSIGEVIVAGGGARNPVLMARLRTQLAIRLATPIVVLTHADLGIDDKAKEAIAFALMAYRALHGEAGNVPACTGATKPQILGQIAPGENYRMLMQTVSSTWGNR